MRRREFIAGLGSAAAWPVVARAQQKTVPVIGYLDSRSAERTGRAAYLRRSLAETGYVTRNDLLSSLASVGLHAIRPAEAVMEQDPALVPVAWEKINDLWYNCVKGHNPSEYFGIYDVARLDTFWLDKA